MSPSTWPEYRYAAVDIFSCSQKLDHAEIQRELKRVLSAQRVSKKSFRRGMIGRAAQGP